MKMLTDHMTRGHLSPPYYCECCYSHSSCLIRHHIIVFTTAITVRLSTWLISDCVDHNSFLTVGAQKLAIPHCHFERQANWQLFSITWQACTEATALVVTSSLCMPACSEYAPITCYFNFALQPFSKIWWGHFLSSKSLWGHMPPMLSSQFHRLWVQVCIDHLYHSRNGLVFDNIRRNYAVSLLV